MLIFLLLVSTIYLFFLTRLWKGLSCLKQQNASNTSERAYSIIIAAHNEEANIEACLDAVFAQEYPADKLQVVLGADRCTDDTVKLARRYKKANNNLEIVEIETVPDSIAPKKYAIERAIEAAQFDNLLFLDADVIATPLHVETINTLFNDETAAVVGLMKFVEPKNLFQELLVYEKLSSWVIAGAGVGNGSPVISYGGNWGYTRQAFEQVGGFGDVFSSLSGDDDLLLQRMGEKNLSIQMCLTETGWVRMDFPDSFAHFLRQRRRHFSAGKRYTPALKWGYLLYHLSNLVLWTAWLFYLPALLFLLAKIIVDTTLLKRASRIFQERLRISRTLVFNLAYVLYNSIIGPLGHVGKIRW